ncbi:hypothetical protein HBI56_104790 [Parastagonospora nodorum]|nr:hypothetical protein HBI10_163630 [Parastagonospora nodorum]KAH4021603.1 hypothetical protein HBI13_104860 [Parastagonospora nodorum]KAH4030352.1 hypothetical protein HBI09_128350 [Parastagonospora nodorum]KAH4913123.1 hypothetical protein HBH74_166560 [Parastagonospora nodorum]KAH4951096.1 hypothetical protein HBH73_109040 [Parastagonospora nodorum]
MQVQPACTAEPTVARFNNTDPHASIRLHSTRFTPSSSSPFHAVRGTASSRAAACMPHLSIVHSTEIAATRCQTFRLPGEPERDLWNVRPSTRVAIHMCTSIILMLYHTMMKLPTSSKLAQDAIKGPLVLYINRKEEKEKKNTSPACRRRCLSPGHIFQNNVRKRRAMQC